MINSVSSYETKSNPFGVVSSHNSDADFWLKEKEVKSDEFTINDVLTPEKARKTHNIKAIGISIALSTVAVAGTALLLLKGGPKGLGKTIEKLRAHYLEKLQKAKLDDKTAKHSEFILGKLNYLRQKGEAINNFTTMKDYAFKRFMYALGKPTRDLHAGITKWFEKLGLRTVERSYGETASRLLQTEDLNYKLITKIKSGNPKELITINGKTFTRDEWAEKLLTYTKDIEDSYTFHFGETRRNERLKKMRENAQELEKSFNQKGDLWFLSKDTFKNFVAEQSMHPDKMHIQTPIKNVKKCISYTKEDLLQESNEKITKISSVINFGEKDTLEAMSTLKKDLKSFTTGGDVTKEQLIQDIDNMLKEFSKATKPADKERLSVLGEFQDLKLSVIDYTHGEVEEVLDIYKALVDEKDFKMIKNSYNKVIKSLNKSINLETEEFVNKLRDLTMGSAPTDILTNLLGIGTLLYYLGKSDDNQQRMGIALKYGFPALTLIGVGLYGNAKLFAGSKSLLFGLGSSYIINRIGTAANEILMRHFENKKPKVKNEKSE